MECWNSYSSWQPRTGLPCFHKGSGWRGRVGYRCIHGTGGGVLIVGRGSECLIFNYLRPVWLESYKNDNISHRPSISWPHWNPIFIETSRADYQLSYELTPSLLSRNTELLISCQNSSPFSYSACQLSKVLTLLTLWRNTGPVLSYTVKWPKSPTFLFFLKKRTVSVYKGYFYLYVICFYYCSSTVISFLPILSSWLSEQENVRKLKLIQILSMKKPNCKANWSLLEYLSS